MLQNEDLLHIANVFQSQQATKEDIADASERCFLHLYKSANLTSSLNELCHIKFNQKVANKNTAVLPQMLPPTANAAKYHG